MLEVGTFLPIPRLNRYMLVLMSTRLLNVGTLTHNPIEVGFMLMSKIIWLEAVTTLLP